MYQPSIKVLNVYNAVFLGILPRSPHPAADLRWLGLSEDLVRFSGTTAYSPGIPTGREFRDMLLARAGGMRLATFFVTHPGQAIPLIQSAIAESLDLRVPYLGHFERARGLPRLAQSHDVAFWSDMKRALLPRSPWILVGLLVVTLGVATDAYHRARSDGVKLLGTLLVALLAMGLVQLIVVSFGNGLHEVRKQLFLFNVIFDVVVAVDVAWFMHRLPEVVRSLCRQRSVQETP
jgi:hypothetical protein